MAAAKQRLAQRNRCWLGALQAEKSGIQGRGSADDSSDPVGEVLKQTASREQAGRVGELLMTVNELSTAILRAR